MTIYKDTSASSRLGLCIRFDFFEGQNSGVAIYHRTGCPGDKKRIWFTYDRDPLGHLDRADKQALLEFMHKSGHAVASINL